jgi:hypothetical protein
MAMQTETTLVWHHVTHDGGEATGLPKGETRNLLVFTSRNETVMIETLHWSDGRRNLDSGFWAYRGDGYYTRRDDAYIIAWANLPQPCDVLTDEEGELYE